MTSAKDDTGGAVGPAGGGGAECHAHHDHNHWQWPDSPDIRTINIALQGGGSHGAFTWGVLDRLLEEKRIAIESISGTSAGAVNAVVIAEGLHHGGPDEARRRLEAFWKSIALGAQNPLQQSMFDILLSNWSLETNPMLAAFEMMSRVVSPYQFNPLNLNPLKELLEQRVDFTQVQACLCTQLYISATNVHTGRVRVFTGEEVTADAVMASACLPYIFQAVEIDGVPYWDGGYMGNPVLFPFLDGSISQDILIVQVNPIQREKTPTSAREIADRINEISFNAPLIKELRHIDFINRAVQSGDLKRQGYREVYLHRIGGGDEIARYPASTKLNAEWSFLRQLRDAGRETASRWLEANFDSIGRKSTMKTSPYLEFAFPAEGLRRRDE
jgi:NTE family protein